jgi:hypothetical protein
MSEAVSASDTPRAMPNGSHSGLGDLTSLLGRFSVRTYRIVGAVIVVLGIPSVFIFWGDQGAAWGIFILVMHLYMGALIAFGLPWLQRRQAKGPVT